MSDTLYAPAMSAACDVKSIDTLDAELYRRDEANTGSGVQGNTPSVSSTPPDADRGRAQDVDAVGHAESTDMRMQEFAAGGPAATQASPRRNGAQASTRDLLDSDVVSPANPREGPAGGVPRHY